MFVQFESADEEKIIASFGCLQTEESHPNQGEVGEDDPRWSAFLNAQAGFGYVDNATAARQQVETARLHAYADPVTGSDRYFAEAMRLNAVKDSNGAADARAKGLARYAEIQTANPWPVEPSVTKTV